MSFSKTTRQLFDDWALRGRAEGMERGHWARAIQALEAIPIEPGQRALDLGCGNGWATRWLRDRVGPSGSAVGIDVAPEMLERARAQSAGIEGLSFERCAFDELPWEDGVFDHAFSMEALYYAPDLPAALESIARVLRRGGTLSVCIDFFEENPYSAGWPEQLGVEMKRLPEQGWRAHMEQAGFEVEACFRCFDPRPAADDLPEAERAEVEDFRKNIGSLALRGRARG